MARDLHRHARAGVLQDHRPLVSSGAIRPYSVFRRHVGSPASCRSVRSSGSSLSGVSWRLVQAAREQGVLADVVRHRRRADARRVQHGQAVHVVRSRALPPARAVAIACWYWHWRRHSTSIPSASPSQYVVAYAFASTCKQST